MKWFTKLTKQELLAFWKTQDSKVDDSITIKDYGNYAIVWFGELGWGRTKKERQTPIETRYDFTDFSVSFYDVYTDEAEENEINGNYILFMAEKFGKPYIADLLQRDTGVLADNWLELMGSKV